MLALFLFINPRHYRELESPKEILLHVLAKTLFLHQHLIRRARSVRQLNLEEKAAARI